MVLHPETGSDSPIGSDRDRGCDSNSMSRHSWPGWEDLLSRLSIFLSRLS